MEQNVDVEKFPPLYQICNTNLSSHISNAQTYKSFSRDRIVACYLSHKNRVEQVISVCYFVNRTVYIENILQHFKATQFTESVNFLLFYVLNTSIQNMSVKYHNSYKINCKRMNTEQKWLWSFNCDNRPLETA